jgi:hypothetical protein
VTNSIEGAPSLKMRCVERKGKRRGRPPKRLPEETVDQLAGLLPDEALSDAVRGLDAEEITGPGGLITQLAGRVIEAALGAELTEHLGYPPGQRRRAGPATSAMAGPRRRSVPTSARCRSTRRATATRRLSRGWWPSARPGWPGWTTRSWRCTPAA